MPEQVLHNNRANDPDLPTAMPDVWTASWHGGMSRRKGVIVTTLYWISDNIQFHLIMGI
ncbi:hypothetical protein LDL36_13645 [Komagataeibacter sp. FNDCR1]|nr:hypothetical protein [Komagataeibacter sp. FNDCR1]